MGWREDNADINEKIHRIRMQGLILRMRMEQRELAERSFKSWLMWERYKMELRRERLEMRSPESGKTQPRNNKGQYKKYKTDGSGNDADSTGLTNAANGDRIKTDVSSAPAVKSHSRAELLKMIEKSNACEKAVFAEDTPENCFASNAKKIPPVEGMYDVALHGAFDHAAFFGESISASDLAKIIKSRKDYKPGTPIRLISCDTGNIEQTGDCFAQLLATELNVKVCAPEKVILVESNGDYYIGEPGNKALKTFWSRRYW